jgi:hypothetical protein
MTVAFFGLFGSDAAMSRTTYSGRESATAKAQRKQAEASAARAKAHRRSAGRVLRAAQAAEDAARRAERTPTPVPSRKRGWW